MPKGDNEMEMGKLVKSGKYGMKGGLAGFLFGFGLQALLEIAGLPAVASVPVSAVTPLVTLLGAMLGFAEGME